MTENLSEIERLAERHGFPAPVGDFKPLVSAQIDLSEPLGDMPRACCCALHGSLHDRATCCPTHRRARAGIPVPTMPLDQSTEGA